MLPYIITSILSFLLFISPIFCIILKQRGYKKNINAFNRIALHSSHTAFQGYLNFIPNFYYSDEAKSTKIKSFFKIVFVFIYGILFSAVSAIIYSLLIQNIQPIESTINIYSIFYLRLPLPYLNVEYLKLSQTSLIYTSIGIAISLFVCAKSNRFFPVNKFISFAIYIMICSIICERIFELPLGNITILVTEYNKIFVVLFSLIPLIICILHALKKGNYFKTLLTHITASLVICPLLALSGVYFSITISHILPSFMIPLTFMILIPLLDSAVIMSICILLLHNNISHNDAQSKTQS